MITLSVGAFIAFLLLAFVLGAGFIPVVVYLFLKLPTRLYRESAHKPASKSAALNPNT